MSTTKARAESLIDNMERLAALFRQETALARRNDRDGLRAIAEAKHPMVRAFEEATRGLRQEQPAFLALEDGVKARLKQAMLDFRAAAEENASLLRAATLVTQATVNTLVGTINRERANEQGYVARGGLAMPAGYGKRAAPGALSLNQTF